MGGDLTRGEVKGNEIACPFHDWRWGGDGRCKRVVFGVDRFDRRSGSSRRIVSGR
jgi:phenylpropionate dioxygenase-like ring-hydroxylating dioxygenase large terminal subunit